MMMMIIDQFIGYLRRMKVYAPDNNHKVWKILMAAKIYSREVQHEIVDFDAKISKPFKDNYPHYSLPVLETETGKFVFGTHSILAYLSGNAPSHPEGIQYLQKIQKQLQPATGVLCLHIKGHATLAEEQIQKCKKIHTQWAKSLNEKLGTKSFLTGDVISIADISCFWNLESARKVLEKEWEKFKNLDRWMRLMRSTLS